MPARFKDVKITDGGFEGQEYHQALGPMTLRVIENGKETLQDLKGDAFYGRFSAGFPLFLIREAWGLGCSFEREADGYGPGRGTHGDWSGIRDSSPEAVDRMLEKALNFIFPSRPLL